MRRKLDAPKNVETATGMSSRTTTTFHGIPNGSITEL